VSKREDAKKYLVHLFKSTGECSGGKWHSDAQADAESIVDMIMDGVKEELKHELPRSCSCNDKPLWKPENNLKMKLKD